MYYKLSIHRIDGWPNSKWWDHPEIFRSKKQVEKMRKFWTGNIWDTKVKTFKKRPVGILKPRQLKNERKSKTR